MIKNLEALQEDFLKQVTGGEQVQKADQIIENTLKVFKAWGYSFEEFSKLVVKKYNESPSIYSTTGSAEDLKEYLERCEAAWNSFEI